MIQSVVCNCSNTTKKDFLCKYVTTDETWIYYFTLGSNQQSRFWPLYFGMFIDYLEKGRTINSKCYIALLVHLKEEIEKKKKKRPQMGGKKVFFSPYLKLIATMAKLHELHPHPPYSPNLVPSD